MAAARGQVLPYPSSNLAAEIILFLVLTGVEAIRNFFGQKGNLTESLSSVVVSHVLTVPVLVTVLYFLLWQTYVLRLEVIMTAIQLVFLLLEIIFGIVAVATFARPHNPLHIQPPHHRPHHSRHPLHRQTRWNMKDHGNLWGVWAVGYDSQVVVAVAEKVLGVEIPPWIQTAPYMYLWNLSRCGFFRATQFALDVLRELQNRRQSHAIFLQRAWIPDIQGNYMNPQQFGNGTPQNPRHMKFPELASSTFRMVALHAANIPQNLWPPVHSHPTNIAGQRNLHHLQTEPQPLQFRFTDVQAEATEFWGQFDHIFPHMMIRERLAAAQSDNDRVEFQGMMLIFDYNPETWAFERVVIITSHAHARESAENNLEMTEAYVNVVCSVYRIAGEHSDYGDETKKFVDIVAKHLPKEKKDKPELPDEYGEANLIQQMREMQIKAK